MEGLVLCMVAAGQDVERVAAFNSMIRGLAMGSLTRSLFLHCPATRGGDLYFVADERADSAGSSLYLIPRNWCYG